MQHKEPVDYVHTQVSIRGFAAWLAGAALGFYIGVCLMLPGNLAPVVGGTLGWLIGGYVLCRLIKVFWRSKPKYTISARTASSALLGMTIGGLIGDFLSVKFEVSRLIWPSLGLAAGLFVGGLLGHASTKATLQEEQKRARQERQPSLEENH